MAAVQGTIQQAPNACGLVIIVSNSYKDTNCPLLGTYQDALRMRDAFGQLNFATHLEHELGKDRLEKLAAEAARCTYPKSYGCIAFVFSGHGQDANNLITDDKMLVNTQTLIEQFLPKNAKRIGSIPKLFFFDACRGAQQMEGLLIPRGFKIADRMTVPPEGNFLVAYSNLPGYVSYEIQGKESGSGGGLWLSTLAKHITTSNEDIGATLTLVNQELVTRYQTRHGRQAIQQPVYESRLNVLVKLRSLAGLAPAQPTVHKPIPGGVTRQRYDDPDPAPPQPGPTATPQDDPLSRKPQTWELDYLGNPSGTKSVKIIERLAGRWQELISHLRLPGHTAGAIAATQPFTPSNACRGVFQQWLDGGDELLTPKNWDMVIKVTQRMGNSALGEEIKAVLLQ